MIMEQSLSERVIELACTIQQIPAPTFAESERAAFIQERFNQEGLTRVTHDDLGNVYGCIPGKLDVPPLVVTAHLDTVFPLSTDLSLLRQKDRITGPGIGDNSLGLASLFSLAWSLSELPRDVWLVANVCEEGLGNLAGIKAVVERFGSEVLAYIVLEGMSLGQIYNRGLGVRRYRISVETPGGHAWVDYGSPSAIHELAEIAVRVKHLAIPEKPCSSFNIGLIEGGTSVNTIASHASLELDLRSEDLRILEDLAQQVESLVSGFKLDAMEQVRIETEVIGQRPAGILDDNHPLVSLAASCIQAQGLKPHLRIGSTDVNYPLSCGIPAICVGITTGGGAHTTHEFIETAPVAKGLAQINQLVKLACSLNL